MRFYGQFLRPLRTALVLAVLGFPSALLAEEPIPIQQILEDPRIYHLRQVTLQGTARDVQPLDPYKLPNEIDVCYGAYLFKLEDDTGVISVAVLGICKRPLIRDPEIEDGQRIEVSATIQAPSHGGYYLSFQGLKVATEQEGFVQAVATRILPIIE
jgi:hypothetical protein